MVGVYFKGRLGNQLFQYAYLLYLKSKYKDKVFFFPNPHHAYIAKYFDLGTYHNLTLGSKLYSIMMRCIPRILPFKDVFFHNFVAPKEKKPENFTIHHGYFQSDWYLKQIEGGLKLPLKEKYIRSFHEAYGELFSKHKTLVVHIRRTDFLSYGKRDISLPIEYFVERLNAVNDLDSYKVIFVSDDLPYVKRFFPEKANYIFTSNSEIIDFQIIQNADIAIISNSTFSWWACYLSAKKQVVYAPKNWMAFNIGREHPRGVMTEKFNWCDVAVKQDSSQS